MKIVVLDGYTLNPGDLSWVELEKLGECTFYDRTSLNDVAEVITRIGDAELGRQPAGLQKQWGCG